LNIKIPERFSDNFGEPLKFLFEVLIKLNKEQPLEVLFDFSESRFVPAFLVGGIIAIENNLKETGTKVFFSFGEQPPSGSYFSAIHFSTGFDFTGMLPETMNKKMEEYQSKTYIPLILFPTSKAKEDSSLRENVLSAINSILKKQLNLKGDLLEAIYYLIDELTNNISDHSGSSKGILFAQVYPSKNYMDVCIVDYGKGIRNTYLESGKASPESDEEAIEMAINGKSTKDLPESRGFGISTSRKMLTNGLKGKFFLCSGKAMFYQNFEKQEIVTLPDFADFKGCIVALRIPIIPNSEFEFYKYTS